MKKMTGVIFTVAITMLAGHVEPIYGAIVEEDFSEGRGDWALRDTHGDHIVFTNGVVRISPNPNGQPSSAYLEFDTVELLDGETLRFTVAVATDNTEPGDRDVRIGIGLANPLITGQSGNLGVPMNGYVCTLPSGGASVGSRVAWIDAEGGTINFFNSSTRIVGDFPQDAAVSVTDTLKTWIVEITRLGEELLFSGSLDGVAFGDTLVASSGAVIEGFRFNTIGLGYAYATGQKATFDNVKLQRFRENPMPTASRIENGNLVLSWPHEEGRTVTIWSSTNLVLDPFRPEAVDLHSAVYTAEPGDPARFFRVSSHDAFSGAMVQDDFSAGQGSWAARGDEGSIRFEEGVLNITPAGTRSAAVYHLFDPVALRDGETLRLTVDVSTDRPDPRGGDIRVGLGFASLPILSGTGEKVPLGGYYQRIPSGGDTRNIPVIWKPEPMEPDYFFDSGTDSLGDLGNTQTVGASPVELVLEITRFGEELIFSGGLDGAGYTTTVIATGDRVIDRFLFNTVGLAYRYSIENTVTYDNVRVELDGKQFPVDAFYRSSDGTDAGPSIRRAVAAAQTYTERNEGLWATVWFTPDAVYRLEERTGVHPQIELYGARRVTFSGNNALLVSYINNNHFSLWRCSDVIIENLRLDLDPLPFTQGTITGIHKVDGKFDVQIEEGFPPPPVGTYLVGAGAQDAPFFNPDGTHNQNWFHVDRVTKPPALPPDVYRVFALDAAQLDPVSRGDRVVLKRLTDFPIENLGARRVFSEEGELISNGAGNIELRKCDGVTIRNVTSYSARAQTVHGFGNRNLIFDAFNYYPKPGTGRLLASNKGGLILRSTLGPVTITNCRFESAADDLINISDHPLDVQGLLASNQIEITDERYPMEQSVGWTLLIVDPETPALKGTCRVVGVVKVDGKTFCLTLDQMVFEPGFSALSENDWFYVERLQPARIEDSVLVNSMKKGVISRGPTEISGCTFSNLHYGVHHYFQGSAAAGEGPFAYGLTVDGNEFSDILTGCVVLFTAGTSPFNAPQFNVVKNNVFNQSRNGHGIQIIRQNTVEISNNHFWFAPSVPSQRRAISHGASTNLVITGNSGDRL